MYDSGAVFNAIVFAVMVMYTIFGT